MIAFLQQVASIIDMVIQFVVNFFKGLIEMIGLLISGIAILPTIFATIPSQISIFLTIGLSVTIVRFLIRKGDD